MSFPYLDLFQMIHCIAVYYDSKNSQHFTELIQSCVDMIPDNEYTKILFLEALNSYNLTYIELQNSSSLIRWTYTINSYFHQKLNGTSYMPFNMFLKKYESIVISTWAHPTWKMIHYYASKFNRNNTYAISYKVFIHSLKYLLPCGKCRAHLTENLKNHPIEPYLTSPSDLFTWSYVLHQTVSSQTGKTGIDIRTARQLYNVL